MGKALSFTFNKEKCGTIEKLGNLLWEFVGRPGRESVGFFGGGLVLPRRA